MADYYASIFGTEKDKVNCSFYLKIGACRHGDRCSRVHNKPSFSQTVLIQNLYINLQNFAKAQGDGKDIGDNENQRHFDEFYEDIYVELEKEYGEIDEMNVCDNLGDHLIGNVYVKFKHEEDAENAVEKLNNRWFAGKPVYAELSTVTDFREAACRQYEKGTCERAGQCNFMHIKQISSNLKRRLFRDSRSYRRHSSRGSQISNSRSRSRSRSNSISPSRSPIHRSKSKSRSKTRSRSSSLVRPPLDDSPIRRSRSITISPRYTPRRRNRRSRRSGRRRRNRSRSPVANIKSRSRSPLTPPLARSRTRSPSPISPIEHSSSNKSSSRRSNNNNFNNNHNNNHHKSSRKRH